MVNITENGPLSNATPVSLPLFETVMALVTIICASILALSSVTVIGEVNS